MGRPVKKQPRRVTVAIIGDGQTERIYFADVRDTDRPRNLTIFPDYPRKIGSYKGILSQALDLIKDYDHVYVLIDMDKVIHDGQQAGYAKTKAAAEKKGVKVLENNPCFETWLLLHFVQTGRPFANCAVVAHELAHAGRIPRYDKSERFQTATRLYCTYKERIATHGIPNARRLEIGREDQSELYPRAEVFRFFEWYLNPENKLQ